MAHNVKCLYCGKQFDRDKVQCTQIGRRYAHVDCADAEVQKINQEEADKCALDDYIIKLLKIDYIDARIRKQINTYIKDYNFTYSGMKKALIYFYEIKGNSVEKANGGIGIIPYIYRQAFEYYYSLWEAQQKNNDKIISEYKPTVVEVTIPQPKRNIRKRNLFSFLDDEEGEI